MADDSKLLVDILGVRFSLKADEDPIYLESLISFFNSQVKESLTYSGLDKSKESLKTPSALKTAILAGILTSDRFYRERRRSNSLAQKVLELEKTLRERDSSWSDSSSSSLSKDLIENKEADQKTSRLVDSLMNELEAVLED